MGLIGDLPRLAGKAVFAAGDLFLGSWPGPRILIYHQVGSDLGRQMEVKLEHFSLQIDHFRSHGSIVSLEEALSQRGNVDSRFQFVLSFDDGYSDLYEAAFPLLREANLPFTVYISTRHIETGEAMAPGATPISWEQLREMNQTGLMTLGSHTHAHADLRGLDRSAIEEDLETCDRLIRKRLQAQPVHFAYPWGYWSPVADTIVRSRYETAALGTGGPVTGGTDPFMLHRLPIQRSDGVFFTRRKVKGGMRLEETVRRRLRGYRGP